MLSVKETIIFLRYWCLKLSMGLRHAPSDRIVMNFDANGYDTRGSEMDLYLITLCKEEIVLYIYIYIYMGSKVWNELPEFVQNSTDIGIFTHLQNVQPCH